MPSGYYNSNGLPYKTNNTSFKKGEHYSIKTEIKKGERKSIGTEFPRGILSTPKPFKRGQKAWNKGKVTSLEVRERIRQGTIEAMRNPLIREKIRIARANQILPTHDTSIEIKVQDALKEKGIQFTKHKLLLGKYRVDLFIAPNIVIECDGDYWHNLDNVKKIDKERNKVLNDNGYIVYRFWEHEIKNNINQCLTRLNLAI